jgi:hypothetical protein
MKRRGYRAASLQETLVASVGSINSTVGRAGGHRRHHHPRSATVHCRRTAIGHTREFMEVRQS